MSHQNSGICYGARTEHVRAKVANVTADRAGTQLHPGEHRYIEDLLTLERWVEGEISGYAASICCFQLGKRLGADLKAIEAELLSPQEAAQREEARAAGERRRHRYAAAYRRAASAGIPPR